MITVFGDWTVHSSIHISKLLQLYKTIPLPQGKLIVDYVFVAGAFLGEEGEEVKMLSVPYV